MNNITSIDKIINDLSDYIFDRSGAIERCVMYFSQWGKHKDSISIDSEYVRQSMISDLETLGRIIDEHASREFMALPETFDEKYNHWVSLGYIINRWYNLATSREIEVWEWYVEMGKVNDATIKKGHRRICADVVKLSIDTLKRFDKSG